MLVRLVETAPDEKGDGAQRTMGDGFHGRADAQWRLLGHDITVQLELHEADPRSSRGAATGPDVPICPRCSDVTRRGVTVRAAAAADTEAVGPSALVALAAASSS